MENKCPECGGFVEKGICINCGLVVEQPGPTPLEPEKPRVVLASETANFSASDIPSTVPWETKPRVSWWDAFIETIKLIINKPSIFFRIMPLKNGYWEPLLFGFIISIAATVLSQIYGLFIGTPFQLLGMATGQDFGQTALGVGMSIVGAFVGIGVSFILIPMGFFIGAGILHLMLMIVGGANEDFEATFRVVAYS
jgi:hypothetical protein